MDLEISFFVNKKRQIYSISLTSSSPKMEEKIKN